jgi:hypothetical protein
MTAQSVIVLCSVLVQNAAKQMFTCQHFIAFIIKQGYVTILVVYAAVLHFSVKICFKYYCITFSRHSRRQIC